MPGYSDPGFDTLALHAGAAPDPSTGARAVPIHLSTSFVFESSDHAASLFNLERPGHVYSRLSNPTTAVFEERMAALDGGLHVLLLHAVAGSGAAALDATAAFDAGAWYNAPIPERPFLEEVGVDPVDHHQPERSQQGDKGEQVGIRVRETDAEVDVGRQADREEVDAVDQAEVAEARVFLREHGAVIWDADAKRFRVDPDKMEPAPWRDDLESFLTTTTKDTWL